MHKIIKIAQREYVETVKRKMFLFGMVVTPVLIVTMLLLVGRVSSRPFSHSRATKEIAVADLSNALFDELTVVLDGYNTSHPRRKVRLTRCQVGEDDVEAKEKELIGQVRTGRLDGYLVVARDVLTGGTSRCYMQMRNISDIDLFTTVQRLVNDAAVNMRFRLHDISQDLIAELQRNVPIEQIDISGADLETKREMSVVIMVPFFFLFLMFMGVFGMNQQMLTSVIEEKSSRVMEILLSAVTPFELMAGKILGLTAVGFTLISVWGVTASVTASAKGVGGLVDPAILGYFFIYFVLGFLLISSLLAAIGSVCNTVREAQALMAPLSMVLVLPMVGWFFVAQNPDGALAVVLSFIPPVTPMIMILRIAVEPRLSPVQIFASIALLCVSVPVVMLASAKIFHIGILMYGKPPRMRELLRWLCAK